jgi:hypothetical protein
VVFTDRETKSFAVNGTPSVNVGTFDSSVIVHAWDKPGVVYRYQARRQRRGSKKHHIESSQRGSAISIVAKSEHSNGSAGLEISLPRNANLHLSSEDGRLTVAGVSGELIARTGDGSIEIEGGKGRIQANTGDGRIRIVNFEGEVDARTGDGSIALDGNFPECQPGRVMVRSRWACRRALILSLRRTPRL